MPVMASAAQAVASATRAGEDGAEEVATAPRATSKPPEAAVQRLLQKVGVETLEQCTSAGTLSWSGDELDDEDAMVVAYVVAVNAVITELLLTSNQIGDSGATAIADALRVNAVLTMLVLDDNQIADAGASAIADALRVNAVLTKPMHAHTLV